MLPVGCNWAYAVRWKFSVSETEMCHLSLFVIADFKVNGEASKAALANEDCPHIDQAVSPEEVFSPVDRERPCFLLTSGERGNHIGGRVRKGT